MKLSTRVFASIPRMPRIYANLKAAGISRVDVRGHLAVLHSLRHSFGTWLWETGANPLVIQELMRHRDLKMTNRCTDTAGLVINSAVVNLPSFDLTAEGIHKYARRFPTKRITTCRRVA